MKESKSSSKLNDLHGRYKSMKDDEITSQKKLAHVMSEVKIPEANKISRNIGISENDLTLKTHFNNSMIKLENCTHNRSRIKQLNLYESSEGSKTIGTLKMGSPSKKSRQSELSGNLASTSFNYKIQTSPNRVISSFIKSSEKKKKNDSKTNLTRINRKFEVVNSYLEKSGNQNSISKVNKYMNEKSKHKSKNSDLNIGKKNFSQSNLMKSSSTLNKWINDVKSTINESTKPSEANLKYSENTKLSGSQSTSELDKAIEEHETIQSEISNHSFRTKSTFLFQSGIHK